MKIKSLLLALGFCGLMLSGCVASVGAGPEYGYYPPAQPYYAPVLPYYYAPRPVVVVPVPYYRPHNGGYRRDGGNHYRRQGNYDGISGQGSYGHSRRRSD